MPRMEEILDQVDRAKYITTLDLGKRYWQVPVAEEDSQKTAFITPRRLYQLNDAFWSVWSTRHIPANDGPGHQRITCVSLLMFTWMTSLFSVPLGKTT